MAKRLTKIEKNEIKTLFINGEGFDFLTNKFEVSKLTIIRNLKKLLGENQYKNFLNKNIKSNKKKNSNVKINIQKDINPNNIDSPDNHVKSSFDSVCRENVQPLSNSPLPENLTSLSVPKDCAMFPPVCVT